MAAHASKRVAPELDLGRGLLAVRGDQRPYPVRGQRPLSDPIVDTRQIQFQLDLAAPRDGVEESDVLEARAALALAAIGHDDVIEGLIAPSAPRQANGNHGRFALVPG